MTANDLDQEGDLRGDSIVVTDGPINGTLLVNSDGTVDYSHDGSETLEDSFRYVVSDRDGAVSQVASVRLAIIPVNDLPVVGQDAATVQEGATTRIDLVANDFDADGFLDLSSITIVRAPSHGVAVLNGDGTVDFIHDGSESEIDTFDYVIRDDQGGLSARGNVTVTILPVNDAPRANDDSATVDENGTLTIDLIANDFDPENRLDPASIVVLSAPIRGQLNLRNDGSVDYTHDGSETNSDQFVYSIRDTEGLVSGPATVQISIQGVNDAPLAADDETVVAEGGETLIAVTLNDVDAESALDLASITIVQTPVHGVASVESDGTIRYRHDGSETLRDSLTYTIRDTAGASSDEVTVAVTVTPVNDAPVADGLQASVSEGQTVTLDLLSLSSDVDDGIDPASISIITSPQHAVLVIHPDGTVGYIHDGSETTADSFAYVIRDFAGAVSPPATVALTVTPVNDAPIARDDFGRLQEGGRLTINVMGNDVDADSDLLFNSIMIDRLPANGTVHVNPNGSIEYVHDGGETLSDLLSYTIRDSLGAVSAPATVQISVDPINDRPEILQGDEITVVMSEDGDPLPFALIIDAIDPDDAVLDWSISGSPNLGTAALLGEGDSRVVTYTPFENIFGADQFVVLVADGRGEIDTITVNVEIQPVNDAPVAVAEAVSTDQGMPITIDVLANDRDVESSILSPRVTLEPLHGTVVVNADGTLTYDPHPAFFGDDSFAYLVNDGELDSEPAVVSISVAPTEPGVTLINRVLQVIGSENEDKIRLQSKNSQIEVSIRLGNQNKQTWTFDESDIDRIVILGFGGDDKIHMDRDIRIPAFIDGGSGNDRIRSGAGDDEIVGGEGNDRIETNDGDDLVTDRYGDNRIWTRNGNDVVVTGPGNDRIATGDGNDVVQSGSGANLVFAGDGNDWIESGDGDDYIAAGAGDDYVDAGGGANQVLLQAGDDIAVAGSGNDLILGGSGRDLIVGGGGEDRLLGGQDDDLLVSGLWIESDTEGTLRAIHRVWTDPELNYHDRVDAIMSSIDSDDGLVNIAESIANDADADSLVGGNGQDWAWADPDNDQWMLALREILTELT